MIITAQSQGSGSGEDFTRICRVEEEEEASGSHQEKLRQTC
jgi:hypothetical protein